MIATLTLLIAALAWAPLRADDPAAAPATSSAPKESTAASPRCAPRAGDEWWLVDSRHLPDCASAGEPNLTVFKYAADGSWQKATVAQLTEGQTNTTLTCLYVHGNRMDSSDALERGLNVYKALVKTEGAPIRNFRYVMYSWPSEQSQGFVRDTRAKADRTDADGYYLGWLLAQFPNQGDLSLLGYSFGARVVTGALHLRAGGTIDGLKLPTVPADALPIRVSLLAPAVHNYWILPDAHHGQSVSQIDRLFVGMNSCDPALQRYRFLDKCARAEALGYTGVVGANQLGTVGSTLVQLDACCSNGRTHDELPYYASPNIVAELQRNLLWQSVPSR